MVFARTLTEAVLEAAGERLEVSHAPGARGPTADGLGGPVVCGEEGRGVARVSLASGRRPTLLEKDALFYFFSRAERSSVDVQLRFRAEG